jgi:uncharacterized membrane protein YcaP (DUF421 family)
MNAFDFVITVALGSTLAAVCLNKNIALIDGMTCFFLLIFLQFILTWLSVRSKMVKNLITSSPTMLVYKGELLEDVMKAERITIEEVKMAARNHGIEDISMVGILILETTGEISIIETIDGDKLNAFDPLEQIKDLDNNQKKRANRVGLSNEAKKKALHPCRCEMKGLYICF